MVVTDTVDSPSRVYSDGQMALHRLFLEDHRQGTFGQYEQIALDVLSECERLLKANPAAAFRKDVYGRTVSSWW